jgi:hypothetical protein
MKDQKSNSTLLESTKMTSRTSLCDHCSGIFLQVNTLRIIASKPGLQYRRKKCSMIQTALDGCALCRELLCMPYDYKWKEAGVKKPIFVRGFDDRRSWPINLWASTAQNQGARLASTVLARIRDPSFVFQWKGSLSSSGFIKVVRRQTPGCQRSLVLEAAVASGMVRILNNFSSLTLIPQMTPRLLSYPISLLTATSHAIERIN